MPLCLNICRNTGISMKPIRMFCSIHRKESEIEKEFPVMAEKYKTEEALKNKTWGVSLIPLADIHLTPTGRL